MINKIIIKPKNINLINCISFLYFFTINDLNYYKINKLVMDISVQPSVPEEQIFKLYFTDIAFDDIAVGRRTCQWIF